jgi:membrane-bound lytic murein transglycosylase D
MLNSKFSRTVFCSFLLLFVCIPFVSYQHPQNSSALPGEGPDAVSNSATAAKVQLNRNAVAYVRDYIQKNNETLVSVKQRSKATFKAMDIVFKKYNLPVELKYLAVIESELKPGAVSRVGAAGPWQLMPETAKILGLKVSASNDERKQFGKSTKAAAVYLRDLYTEFGDWLLVMAAYNCGPGPVYTAIRKSGSHNFWALQGYLPEESSEHVKKFIATHYYFEGNGSVTTLTKAENIKHNQKLLKLAAAEIERASARQEAGLKNELKRFEQAVAFGN